MADLRHKNAKWSLPKPDATGCFGVPSAQLAVLMDIRDELQEINRHRAQQTRLLEAIRRATGRIKRPRCRRKHHDGA
jgi:hypothetical protein